MSENQENVNAELQKVSQSGNLPAIVRFILASLGGIPVVGGIFGAGAGAWSETEQKHLNNLLAAWVKLQTDEIREIGTTLAEVMIRVDNGFGGRGI